MKTIVTIVLSSIIFALIVLHYADVVEETYVKGKAEGYRVGVDDGYVDGRIAGFDAGAAYGVNAMSINLMRKFDTKYWRDDYCSVNVMGTWIDTSKELRKEREERKGL